MQVKLLEQLEAQKEKRVAHLQQMAVKRMMQAGLTKGWQTWLDLYEERQRSMRMLAAAAGRLMRPALAAALTHWRIDWQQMQQAAIKAAYKARVRLAEEASLKKLAQQAEAAREARVAHLQQSAARRMMQAGLTKGWQTWLDMYLEHQRHKRMLASAAGRLMKPALSAALSAWREDWGEERQRILEEGQRLMRAEAEGRSLAQQAEIDAVRAEMAAALQAKDEELRKLEEEFGVGALSREQEHAKALAEQAEAAHEARVAHLQQMAAKRMMQAGLTKGWQTWLDMYLEHQRHKRMLASAAGRLMKPALSAALTHWRDDWQAEQKAALEEGQRLLRAEAEGRSLAQQAEIDAVRAEMAAALQAKDEQLQALAERSGMDILSQQQEAARALAEALEAEKEKRVAHLQQMAVKRMMQAGLTKGWQTWLDMYLEHQRHQRMLASAAGRLMKPALSAALTHWRDDWQAEQKAALEEGQRLLRAEAEGRSLAQQAEIDAVRAEMAAALQAKDEQLQALAERSGMDILSQQQEAARALAEALEAEKEKRVAHLQQMAVKRMMQAGLTKGWQTWLDMYLEHQRHKRMLASAAGRLMKPALSAALTQRGATTGGRAAATQSGGGPAADCRAEAEGRSLAQQAEIDAVRAEMAAALQAKDEQLQAACGEVGHGYSEPAAGGGEGVGGGAGGGEGEAGRAPAADGSQAHDAGGSDQGLADVAGHVLGAPAAQADAGGGGGPADEARAVGGADSLARRLAARSGRPRLEEARPCCERRGASEGGFARRRPACEGAGARPGVGGGAGGGEGEAGRAPAADGSQAHDAGGSDQGLADVAGHVLGAPAAQADAGFGGGPADEARAVGGALSVARGLGRGAATHSGGGPAADAGRGRGPFACAAGGD